MYKNAAVNPPGRPLLLQLVEIAADRRFRHRKLLGQLRQRGKSPHADQFQQTISTFFGQHGIDLWKTSRNDPSIPSIPQT